MKLASDLRTNFWKRLWKLHLTLFQLIFIFILIIVVFVLWDLVFNTMGHLFLEIAKVQVGQLLYFPFGFFAQA